MKALKPLFFISCVRTYAYVRWPNFVRIRTYRTCEYAYVPYLRIFVSLKYVRTLGRYLRTPSGPFLINETTRSLFLRRIYLEIIHRQIKARKKTRRTMYVELTKSRFKTSFKAKTTVTKKKSIFRCGLPSSCTSRV